MSRWFRHYAGMMRDDKLVGAAIRSKQPVERVVWIWGAILESASEINDDGRFNLDTAEVAYFLRADEADVRLVVDALVSMGRVSESCVVKWGERQFTSDRSADRQARYRERKRAEPTVGDEGKTSGDGAVTSLSQPSDAPETETETETETELDTETENKKEARPTPRQRLELVLDADHAGAVIEHRQRIRKPMTERAAQLLATELSKFPDPNAAADRMIAKGWSSIEAEWPSARASPPPKQKTTDARNVIHSLKAELEEANAIANPEAYGHRPPPLRVSHG